MSKKHSSHLWSCEALSVEHIYFPHWTLLWKHWSKALDAGALTAVLGSPGEDNTFIQPRDAPATCMPTWGEECIKYLWPSPPMMVFRELVANLFFLKSCHMQSPPQIVSSAFVNIKELAKHKALKSTLSHSFSCFLKMWPLGKMIEQSVLGREWLSQH